MLLTTLCMRTLVPPHIIAKVHMTKLENLHPLKQADGASLDFSRHLIELKGTFRHGAGIRQ